MELHPLSGDVESVSGPPAFQDESSEQTTLYPCNNVLCDAAYDVEAVNEVPTEQILKSPADTTDKKKVTD